MAVVATVRAEANASCDTVLDLILAVLGRSYWGQNRQRELRLQEDLGISIDVLHTRVCGEVARRQN